MDRTGEIRLDPDVIVNRMDSFAPLSDLYELPVFAANTEQKAKEQYRKEKERLKQIRRNVFTADGRSEEEKLERICDQIFQVTPVRINYETVQDVSDSCGIWGKAYGTIQDTSGTGAAKMTWSLLEMILLAFMVLLLICQGKRFVEARENDSNIYGR